MLIETVENAEKFVVKQKALGNDVYWDNYDMVFFRPSEKGVTSKDGAFRKGQWGFANRSNLRSDGTWEIDPRNIRYPRRHKRS